MLLNILHRPESGKNHRYYKLQQEYVHRLKLKTTLLLSIKALEDVELVKESLDYHREFGDELGLWLWSSGKNQWGGSAPYWLLSRENKIKTAKYALELFREKIGSEPVSSGSYVLDASSMEIIRELSPATKTVIAGCFEEGVKVFHGCNNSWYLFSEGVPWGPWYPSKGHSFRPAADSNDWSGLVAIPHLSRDLALAYEGRNDFFASHPANVQRGLVNKGMKHDYDFNLVDQYRMQQDFNDGYSFYHVHVSPSWLGDCPNVQDTPEVSQKIYLETLEYLAELRDKGEVRDMHMGEFGEWYRENIPMGKPAVALGKEMLYGSGKHYFWISSPSYRVLVDINQGGSIGDLRPYAGHFESFSGPDSPRREIASYPYIIQSHLRTGTVNHYSDGTRTTLYVSNGEETKDLCYIPSKAEKIQRSGNTVTLTLAPVEVGFKNGLKAKIGTVYEFDSEGKIIIRRSLIDVSDNSAELEIQEYFKGCYGFTEYAEDMHGIILSVDNDNSRFIAFEYTSRSIKADNGQKASAAIPQVNTLVSLESVSSEAQSSEVAEGHLFNPYYTLKLNYILSQKTTEVATCLKIQKNS